MEIQPTRTLADPERASAEEIEEALLHFDELDGPSLERLASHHVHGRHLAVLRGAEIWLSRAEPGDLQEPADLPEPATCPTAEDLYDYGRGPGFEALEPANEARIRVHLEACEACQALVTTLESAPPLPLELREEERLPVPSRGPRRLRPRHHLVLLAAAASFLLAFFFAPQLFSPRSQAGLPEQPTYRGPQSSALLFPRGLVLARDDETGEAGARPAFELQPIEGAATYHVEVFFHDGGAFVEGQLLQRLEGNEPALSSGPLRPGNYTWQAWAVVQGLERDLGAREFEVRTDEPLSESLASLGTSPSTEELVRTVRVLYDAGYETDARELARSLPESREKQAFLRAPGR